MKKILPRVTVTLFAECVAVKNELLVEVKRRGDGAEKLI